MSETITDAINNIKEATAVKIIFGLIIVIIICALLYYFYIKKLMDRECSIMTGLYGTLNGKIKSIDKSVAQCKYNLVDYYIKTSYNCCSGGSYKNDYVGTCNLINVLKQGCRCLDFEIYSIDDNPVVATSTDKNFFVKETYNNVKFSEVMSIIKNYAFSQGTAPNYADPIILHLRIKSSNQKMFSNLADLFESYNNLMLGSKYSYENHGENIGSIPLIELMNKLLIIVDKSNNSFMENTKFVEYVNLTSNSIFMRATRFYDIKYTPDLNEMQEYNKKNITISMPDNVTNPDNPSAIVVREAGCQMIGMRFQSPDQYLAESNEFFDEAGYAFVLKPERLRYIVEYLPEPTPQNPAVSYEETNIKSDYYNFNI